MDFSNLSDEKLVEIIRDKDKELYAEIIRRYKLKLSHYLRKFIRDQDELEDVLQVVFIKCYKNLYGFKINKKFSSWIYRISHNEAINYIKKNYKENIALDDIEYKLVDKKMDVKLDIDRRFLKEKVEKVLVKVKNKYREPLVLFYFEERSYQEISDILRIPVNTVGTLILRAKKILKEELKSIDL